MIEDAGKDSVVVDLDELARAGAGPGPVWTHQGEDLNANLLVFGAGDGVAEHVNAECGVLLVGIAGEGAVTVDGQPHPLRPGGLVVAPKGARRATRAGDGRFVYLACHRRRGGLLPAASTHPGRSVEAGAGVDAAPAGGGCDR